MSYCRLFGLSNAGDLAIRSIGQTVPLSHHVGRYGLGDSDKFRHGSTTSINCQRLSRVIAARAATAWGLRWWCQYGVGWGDEVRDAALPRVAPISVGVNLKSNTEELKK